MYVANTSWYLWNFRLPLLQAMQRRGWRVIAVAPPDEYSPRLERAGFEFVALPIARKGMNPFTDLRLVRTMAAIYRRYEPAIVHHFTIKPVLFGSLAATFARVPSVVNAITGLGFIFISDKPHVRFVRLFVRRLYRLVLGARGRIAIFQNPDDLETFTAQRLISADRARLIRSSGVDVHRFMPADEPTGRPVVTFCARMLVDKGVHELVDAARMLHARGVDVEVRLAGMTDEGNPAAIPHEQLERWTAEGIVRWVGHCDDVPRLLRDSHVAVLPSYREGTPKGLIEAAAAGLPLIATDVPGCREVVRDDVNGLLVPARDAVALADAIEKLARDPQLRLRMGAASRLIAEREFAVERVVGETVAVYEELVGLPSPE